MKDDTIRLKTGLAEMFKGGVIMDVTTAEQAVIAERAGAAAVMALERVPAQIRAEGGVARMAAPKKIREIMSAVSIPVMAKARIGHFAEAMVLQELGVDYIDESEVLTPADEEHHIDKHAFRVPFVCGARNLGEALRRIGEGAAMIRTKGEAGTGDVVHAVKHMRTIMTEMRLLTVLRDDELMAKAKELGAPFELVRLVAREGRLPVPNFSAGGIAPPADASLVMHPGGESTTFLELLGDDGFEALRRFAAEKPLFGTCAGAILLARDVEDSSQPSLGALDIRVRRNGYGRQLDSSIRRGTFQGTPMEMVFI